MKGKRLHSSGKEFLQEVGDRHIHSSPLLQRESRASFIEAFSVDSHTFFCCTCARLFSNGRQSVCSGDRKCFRQVQDSQTLVSFLRVWQEKPQDSLGL